MAQHQHRLQRWRRPVAQEEAEERFDLFFVVILTQPNEAALFQSRDHENFDDDFEMDDDYGFKKKTATTPTSHHSQLSPFSTSNLNRKRFDDPLGVTEGVDVGDFADDVW